MLYSDVVRIGLNHTNSSNSDNSKKVAKKPIVHKLRACVWNAQSLRQKTQTVKDFTDEFGLDIFLFTETWLKPEDKVEIGELERNGEYLYLGSPRVGRPGGGVGCIVKRGIKATQKQTMKTKTFETQRLNGPSKYCHNTNSKLEEPKIPKLPERAIRQLAPLVGHEMRALGEGQLVQVQVLAPGHLLAHLSALQFGLKDC